MLYSTKTLARAVIVSKSAQEMHPWLGVATRITCRIIRKRQTSNFLKYLNVSFFLGGEDISRGDLVHFKRIFFFLWRADYWEIYSFSLMISEMRKSTRSWKSVEEWKTFGIWTRLSPSGCSGRLGRGEGCSEGRRKAEAVLKWLTVFLLESCLIDSFPPSFPTALPSLPFPSFSPSLSTWIREWNSQWGEERRW